MAAASNPKKLKPSSPNPKPYSPPSQPPIPPTPALRRSTRRTSSVDDLQTPQKSAPDPIQSIRGIERSPDYTKNGKTPSQGSKNTAADHPFSSVSPDIAEKRKRKRSLEANWSSPGSKSANLVQRNKKTRESKKKRVYYKKVVFDGGQLEAGDDVYVKRREDASSDVLGNYF